MKDESDRRLAALWALAAWYLSEMDMRREAERS
jgi:hypothetical protein